jgi:hypothetical protein
MQSSKSAVKRPRDNGVERLESQVVNCSGICLYHQWYFAFPSPLRAGHNRSPVDYVQGARFAEATIVRKQPNRNVKVGILHDGVVRGVLPEPLRTMRSDVMPEICATPDAHEVVEPAPVPLVELRHEFVWQ